MKNQFFVIDFGGTSTKAIHYQNRNLFSRHCFESSLYPCSKTGIKKLLIDLKIRREQLTAIVVTGGKSKGLKNSLGGLEIISVNEIEAIGVGGLRAANLRKAVVVSTGTGTAFVVATRDSRSTKKFRIRHVGGLGLGGGTIVGLGKLLCGAKSFDELDKLALQGKSEKVDLVVRDIIGDGIGIIPGDLTAANFARVDKPEAIYSNADIAAGLFTMVGQSTARLAIVLAKQHEIEPIVVIGQVIENEYMQQVYRSMQKIFGGKFVFVADARYRAAEGAFVLALKNSSSS